MTWISDNLMGHLSDSLGRPEFSDDRYDLKNLVGQGGMGEVWSAQDLRLDRTVAIKILKTSHKDERLSTLLRKEALCIAALEHPGIVPIHDLGTTVDGRPFYVMKHIEGETLGSWNALATSNSERLRLMVKLCEVMAFAHMQSVIHCDLKPNNIMVGAFGEILVLDWGLALTNDTSGNTAAGTPGYMAPEQIAMGTVDHRADVYALGKILETTLRPPLSRPLKAIIQTCTRSLPAQRYSSVMGLHADLNFLLDHLPVSAYEENLLERSMRWLERNRFLVWLIIGYLVLRAAIVFSTGF